MMSLSGCIASVNERSADRRSGSQGTSSQPSAVNTSPPSRTTTAPVERSEFGPTEGREVTGPGTAPICRPYPDASRAVTIVPECVAASTTTVIPARAAMIRFRAGKVQRHGVAPGGSSESTAPCSAIRAQSLRWAAG
jgi:hypothetical protein